jgi:4-amino-4-deoxy-L-arabinose transferase-like glycosyltransferase
MYKRIFFICCLLVFFYGGLGAYSLLNNNEGLYAQISWEMLENGNWIIPHLNGVPYIEKPPLLYWLIAGCFKIFGKTEAAARFVPATFGFLTCIVLYFFARSFHKERWGRFSALILASCCGFIIFSRMVFFDVALTFFLTSSALCFYKFYQTNEKKYLYGLSFCMAAAVLTKGLVSIVLMGLVILSFLLIERNFLFLKFFFNPVAIGIFLILTIPWHVLAALQEPGFTWFYFINEHWMRFLDKRIPRDYYTGSLYYYIPRVLGYAVPWTFLAPFFVKKISFSIVDSFRRFLWCWFVAFFCFFSLSKAKANYYMVVGMPPLALWLGAYLENYRWKKTILALALLSSAILVIGGIFYIRAKEDHFSTKSSLEVFKKDETVYLYKRFEEFSTVPFYTGKLVPLLNSESRDLWYGQQSGLRPDLFLSSENVIEKETAIYVMKRDKDEFLKKYGDVPKKIIYDFPQYFIFYLY